MHNRTVVILSALEGNERQIFRPYLTNEKTIYHPVTKTDYYTGTLSTETGDVTLILGRTDQTNVAAALETDRALNHFAPRYAFFVGVAGGLKDVKVGDIVIGKDVYGYERGKTTADGFKARPGAGNSSYSLERVATSFVESPEWQDAARELPNDNFLTPVNVVTGTIASGEKVDGAVTSELHQFLQVHCNHALAVEMEGFGFLEAARQYPQIHALVVRGISDLVDGKSHSEGLGSQPYASTNAASFTISLIRHLYSSAYGNRRLTPTEAKQLANLAGELYPGGIGDNAIWERAGGRVADIATNSNGRTQWIAAIRHISNGGRGATLSSLLDEMLEDFPDHHELAAIRG